MKTIIAAIVAGSLAVTSAAAWHVVAPPLIPVVAKHGAGTAAASGGSAAGASAVAVGIAVLAVAVVWCGTHQPKRNGWRDTWVDGRADFYPSYKPRQDGCVWKKKRHHRSDPASGYFKGK
jgi:hypothetical protein